MYVLRPHALLIYNNLTFTKGKYLKNDNEKKKSAHPSFMARENKSWTRSLLILVALFTKGSRMKLSPTLRLSASQYFDLSIYRILDSLTFTISRTSGMFSF